MAYSKFVLKYTKFHFQSQTEFMKHYVEKVQIPQVATYVVLVQLKAKVLF